MTVSITRDKRTYVFNPENLTFLQHEAADRELTKAGYFELTSNFFSTDAGLELMSKTADKTAQGMAVAKLYSQIHAKLIETGARERLIPILLAPDGDAYSTKSSDAVRKDLLPTLTRAEAEEVMQAFFAHAGIFSALIPKYLQAQG